MKLSIVTITCRRQPLFKKMADTIAANLKNTPMDLIWICVDDRLWHENAAERRQELIDAVDGRFTVRHEPPKPSRFRGPARVSAQDLPDHNGARNTGLALALALSGKDSYVLYLDDCTLLSQSVFAVLKVAAEKFSGLRVPIFTKRDLNVPMNGVVTDHEIGGLHLVPCAETTVAGGCFGAPMSYLLGIDGFDEAYGGESGREDIDAFVRMSRLGLRWLTSKRCAAIQLLHTHTKDDVSLVAEAHRGNSNRHLYAALLKDRRRTLPSTPQEKIGAIGAHTPYLEPQPPEAALARGELGTESQN
jgi:hypothetical protein